MHAMIGVCNEVQERVVELIGEKEALQAENKALRAENALLRAEIMQLRRSSSLSAATTRTAPSESRAGGSMESSDALALMEIESLSPSSYPAKARHSASDEREVGAPLNDAFNESRVDAPRARPSGVDPRRRARASAVDSRGQDAGALLEMSVLSLHQDDAQALLDMDLLDMDGLSE